MEKALPFFPCGGRRLQFTEAKCSPLSFSLVSKKIRIPAAQARGHALISGPNCLSLSKFTLCIYQTHLDTLACRALVRTEHRRSLSKYNMFPFLGHRASGPKLGQEDREEVTKHRHPQEEVHGLAVGQELASAHHCSQSNVHTRTEHPPRSLISLLIKE